MTTPKHCGAHPTVSYFRLGTMGLAYDDWRRTFYPDRLATSRWLGFYASRFDALELNTTFYALPTRERIERWCAAVPATFRFALKVGRKVTHEVPLRHAIEPLKEFVAGVAPHFGPRLGPLLLQLPPWCGIEQAADLRRLLEALPAGPRYAVEFRSADWATDATRHLLADHGVALVGLDHEEHPEQAKLEPTTDFVYIRLVGKHGRFEDTGRELFDPTPRLEFWRDRLAQLPAAPREAWVLFNNDFAGHAPATLRRFARLVGVDLPSEERQTSLFDEPA